MGADRRAFYARRVLPVTRRVIAAAAAAAVEVRSCAYYWLHCKRG
jgi:hypothetical protein